MDEGQSPNKGEILLGVRGQKKSKEDNQAREGQNGKMWTGISGRDFGDEVGFSGTLEEGSGRAGRIGRQGQEGRARKARVASVKVWRGCELRLPAVCACGYALLYYLCILTMYNTIQYNTVQAVWCSRQRESDQGLDIYDASNFKPGYLNDWPIVSEYLLLTCGQILTNAQ